MWRQLREAGRRAVADTEDPQAMWRQFREAGRRAVRRGSSRHGGPAGDVEAVRRGR